MKYDSDSLEKQKMKAPWDRDCKASIHVLRKSS